MRSAYETTVVLFVLAAAIAGLVGYTPPAREEPARPAAVQAAGASSGGTVSAEERKPAIH